MQLVSGATAAGFSIVRLLGCGQLGELYLAEHPRLPRRHALKIIRGDMSADPEYRQRFTRESDLAAALWHPHIVGLYDRGEFDGRLWLSMDYVDGDDAARLLSDTYPDGMPPDKVVEIVSAIADALDYAHDLGLVHRYVNPSNILLSNSRCKTRRILLAGFGVARRLGDMNKMRHSHMIATASYAAPEQLMDDRIDGRADQYALAGTAFHLLTGSPPFAHINPDVVTTKQLSDQPPRPSDVRAELARFDAAFARSLAKVPSDRFRRCQDFAKALAASGSKKSHALDAGAVGSVIQPLVDAAPPTEPAVPGPQHAKADDVVAPPDVLPSPEIGHATTPAEPAAPGDATDETSVAWRRRRLLHAAGLALTIIAVAVGGVLAVMTLRSASESEDTPANIQTPSSVNTIRPAPPATARATPPPPITASAPVTTTAPPSTSQPPETTMRSTSTPSPETTTARTTTPHSSAPPTTTTSTPAGLDTRPAIGMPCGPEQAGTTTTSNSGLPLSCVGTPGGFAWEPPG